MTQTGVITSFTINGVDFTNAFKSVTINKNIKWSSNMTLADFLRNKPDKTLDLSQYYLYNTKNKLYYKAIFDHEYINQIYFITPLTGKINYFSTAYLENINYDVTEKQLLDYFGTFWYNEFLLVKQEEVNGQYLPRFNDPKVKLSEYFGNVTYNVKDLLFISVNDIKYQLIKVDGEYRLMNTETLVVSEYWRTKGTNDDWELTEDEIKYIFAGCFTKWIVKKKEK